MDGNSGDDDILLVQRTLSGDASAFRVLVERHGPAVSRFCRVRLGSQEEAEDAAQDVFLRAYRSLGGFRLGRCFPSWLFAIASNRVKTRYAAYEGARKLRERAESDFSVGSVAETFADPQRAAIDTLEAEAVRAAVGSLAKERRDVVELYYLAGLSVSEVAETLGLGTEAVKSRLWRARKELAGTLSGATGTDRKG